MGAQTKHPHESKMSKTGAKKTHRTLQSFSTDLLNASYKNAQIKDLKDEKKIMK